jgi:flavin reductase (DIM6/NTAB) family NADH-FMN oxidoreductase RutF
MHVRSEPAILYFGTPVALISTRNEDGSSNLAPMSSAFWLGQRAVLGLDASSKTAQNLLRERECVLNLPSEDQVSAIDALALTTGSDPVPSSKVARGYQHVATKFARAGLTPTPSETVAAPRVRECLVQMEARLECSHSLAASDPRQRGRILTFEVEIQRVYVDRSILHEGRANRIDPDKWRPLIMSFQQFYGLSKARLQPSRLASIDEESYRGRPSSPRRSPEAPNREHASATARASAVPTA